MKERAFNFSFGCGEVISINRCTVFNFILNKLYSMNNNYNKDNNNNNVRNKKYSLRLEKSDLSYIENNSAAANRK